MTNYPKSIFDLIDLENFRLRTAMYIGEKRISNLNSFIYGYFYALDTNGTDLPEVKWFNGFHDFTAKYFGWRETTVGWSNIILKECEGDESKALEKFFEVFDEFKKAK